MIVAILFKMKERVVPNEDIQPNHQVIKIREVIILRGKREGLEGMMPVDSILLKIMNYASKLGKTIKNLM